MNWRGGYSSSYKTCYTKGMEDTKKEEPQKDIPLVLPPSPTQEPIAQWRAHRYPPFAAIPWVRIAFVTGFALLVAALLAWQQNYFGTATFVVAGMLATVFLVRTPPVVSVAVFPNAIVFQEGHYPFKLLSGFALTNDRLVLFRSKREEEVLRIPIAPSQHEKLRELLTGHLSETAYQPTLHDVVQEFLRI